MTKNDACELAYKNGYEQGKKDAVKHKEILDILNKYKAIDAIVGKFYTTCPKDNASNAALGVMIAIAAVITMDGEA